jgi:hypothetical protein
MTVDSGDSAVLQRIRLSALDVESKAKQAVLRNRTSLKRRQVYGTEVRTEGNVERL